MISLSSLMNPEDANPTVEVSVIVVAVLVTLPLVVKVVGFVSPDKR
jgi:hypothetical protein